MKRTTSRKTSAHAGLAGRQRTGSVLWLLLWLAPICTAAATGSPELEAASLWPQAWTVHGQFTSVLQYHPAFTAPYSGTNSLDPANSGKETNDVTLFAGIGLWQGAAAYANPEFDQGFGLNDTLGVAGFPSGEAYKVGARNPYFRLPRAFVRQIIDLDGTEPSTNLEDGPNQIAGAISSDNLVITVGKFSVVDIFDTNRYSHDPKSDFLNWSLVDGGAFDYAADAWGYTLGGAIEWSRSWWTLRGGFFALSREPNSTEIDMQFHQFAYIAEFEERHRLWGQPGSLKALAFLNRGRMGSYDDALALARETSSTPSTALVRKFASRPGGALNWEQTLAPDLGVFVRASANDGAQETFDFTDINQSLALGVSLRGDRWGRPDDAVGFAGVINAISSAARAYFADGGLGVLIGDGQLPDYGREKILETYYSMKLVEHLIVSLDYQFVDNPAYNRDRGPVSIFALRLHAEF